MSNTITLGRILREIAEEGNIKGLDWKVQRLYVTRNEQSPRNIKKMLARLGKKYPTTRFTESDAKSKLLFSFYRNIEDHWRFYSREEAEDLKNKIKEVRGWIE